MNSADYVYMGAGLLLALAGFGYYAMEIFRAYKEEKKKIEEDFGLSQKYAPEKATYGVLIFIQMGATGPIYVLLSFILVYVFASDSCPNSTLLASQFVFVMGITSLISNISRIPVATEAVREMAYVPSVEIPEEIKKIESLNERWKKKMEFYENSGIKNGRRHFGKYTIFMALTDTWNIYALLSFLLALIGTGLFNKGELPQLDVSKDLANSTFFAGLIYAVLTVTTVFSMKKSTEIPIEDFKDRIKTASKGFIIPLIAFVFLIYMMLPLLS